MFLHLVDVALALPFRRDGVEFERCLYDDAFYFLGNGECFLYVSDQSAIALLLAVVFEF
mgnify:CR=1 FL=1